MAKGSGRPPHAADLANPARVGPVPKLPGSMKWHPATKRWWTALWSSPWCGRYTDQDMGTAVRLAIFMDKQFRVADGATITVLTKEGTELIPLVLTGADNTAMASMEDRLGLSPRARQVLGWDDMRPEPVPATAPAATAAASHQRQHA